MLSNSRKAHYFIDERALCGKWAYLGNSHDDSQHNSPDNCAECKKRRAKQFGEKP